MRALDMGVNDYIMRPIDRNELMARVRTQVKRKSWQPKAGRGARGPNNPY